MTTVESMNATLEESLSMLDAYEEFFNVRGLPIPADVVESLQEKRTRVTEDLKRWRALKAAAEPSNSREKP